MKKGTYRVGKKTWGEGEGRKQDRPKRAYLVVPTRGTTLSLEG